MRILPALALCGAAAAGTPMDALKAEIQGILDWASEGGRLAVSFAWKDAENEFAMVSGMVNETDGTRRPVTTDDTFLYGSGSKSFTATAIMRLVEQGKVKLTDPISVHVDRLLKKYSGKTLVELWGPRAARATVADMLRMSTGVVDYDTPVFDSYVLNNISGTDINPVTFIGYPAASGTPFMCDPGSCTEYSSTNYVLAGILLTEHSGSDDWTKLVTKSFYPAATQERLSKTNFFTDQPLPRWLTVPAQTGGYRYDPATGGFVPDPSTLRTVAAQNGSIVGFTCANVVAPPSEVARFFWMLLGERSIVNETTLNDMVTFRMMDAGWGAGKFAYGDGLMLISVNGNHGSPPATTFDGWGTMAGHGGEVYGYVSFQGLFWGLNASLSIVLNKDQGEYPDDGVAICLIVQAAAKTLHNVTVDFGCLNPHGWTARRGHR